MGTTEQRNSPQLICDQWVLDQRIAARPTTRTGTLTDLSFLLRATCATSRHGSWQILQLTDILRLKGWAGRAEMVGLGFSLNWLVFRKKKKKIKRIMMLNSKSTLSVICSGFMWSESVIMYTCSVSCFCLCAYLSTCLFLSLSLSAWDASLSAKQQYE